MSAPVIIGNATLYLGDCLEIMAGLDPVDHIIGDPPYEESLHANAKTFSNLRKDSGPELKPIDFDSIDSIRAPFVAAASEICQGWFIAFCTVEGVWQWAEHINAAP